MQISQLQSCMDEKFHIMSSKAYQCQFCEENINGIHKDDHYALCDKFGSFVTDHVCEFCDKIFDDNIVLRNHIKRIHTKSNISNNENITLNSFEETKVEILALLKTFKSKDDSIKFLDWIRDEALDEMKNGCPIINNSNLQDAELVDSRSYNSGEVNQSLNKIEAFSLLKNDVNFALNQNEAFSHVNTLKDHNLIDQEYDKCKYCEKSFKKANFSKNHIHTVHKCHKDFKCNSCGKSFSWASGHLKQHIHPIHQDHKDFIQIEEDVEMNKNEDFEVFHKSIIHHDSNDKTFTKISITNENDDQEYFDSIITSEIELPFASENERKVNSFSKINEKSKCDSYDQSFSLTVHEGQKDHNCQSCGKSFSQASHLKDNIQKIHEISIKQDTIQIPIVNEIKIELISTCREEITECNLSDNNKQKNLQEKEKNYNVQKLHEDESAAKPILKNDVEEHHQKGHKDHKCESCSKLFSEGRNLKRHIQIVHEGCKDYTCESCGKSFSLSQSLKKHLYIVHGGHKDYKCGSCGKFFSQSHHLKGHINSFHEGHKNHKCESCQKSFAEARGLERHIHTIHEGRKDYKCECCDKSFYYACDLKKHIHTIHEGRKDFICESCGWKTTRAKHLKNHINTKHEGHKDDKCL